MRHMWRIRNFLTANQLSHIRGHISDNMLARIAAMALGIPGKRKTNTKLRATNT